MSELLDITVQEKLSCTKHYVRSLLVDHIIHHFSLLQSWYESLQILRDVQREATV